MTVQSVLSIIFVLALIPVSFAGISPTSMDFGTIEAGSKVSKKLTYKNTLKVATRLIVDPTLKSKFCSVSVPGGQISPGKSASVSVSCHFTHNGYNQTESARVLIQHAKGQEVANLRMKAKTIANRCPDVDLNKSAPLKDMPVLDQDGVGICYAFSGTTLVEYELRKKGIKRSLSPIDAALVFKTKTAIFSDELESGLLDFSVNDFKYFGVATKECVDKVIKEVTKDSPMTSEVFTALIHNIYAYENAKTQKDRAQAKEEMDDFCDAYGIENSTVLKFHKAVNNTAKSYFKSLLEPCKKERLDALKWKLPDYDHVYLGSDQKLQRKINDVLSREKPANAGICSEIIKNGDLKHVGIEKTLGARMPAQEEVTQITKQVTKTKQPGKVITKTVTTTRNLIQDKCSPHAVVITAQKKEKGVCQYLVRNSWGASWEGTGLVCACKTSKGYYPDCSKAPRGTSNKVMVGCWVSEKTFLPNLMDVGGFN